MRIRLPTLLRFLTISLFLFSVSLRAQLRPEASDQPVRKPSKPARIIVETSPDAEIYLDDVFQGRASAEGRLVIANAAPGNHVLRATLSGKSAYEGKVAIEAGVDVKIVVALSGPAENSPARPGEPPRRSAPNARLNPKDGLRYVWIPPGTFSMGCSAGDPECPGAEKPPHQVTISRGFWIGQTEVTVVAYKRFAAATSRQMPSTPSFNAGWVNDNMPIVNVSWNDARDFCAWSGGRLPTEAEWEYAARGGGTQARPGALTEVAWYADNSGPKPIDSTRLWDDNSSDYIRHLTENGNVPHPVAEKQPNGFGLYDTLGNAWEWVNDWYDNTYYQTSPSVDPAGPATGAERTLRGGSWADIPLGVRVSSRDKNRPDAAIYIDGIRCVTNLGNP